MYYLNHLWANCRSQLTDWLYPAQCGLCRELIDEPAHLCAACWSNLSFISSPFCQRCGYPFDFDLGETAQCGACEANSPQFHHHRSALHFDAHSKRLIHDLKYYDNSLMLDRYGQWLHQIGQDWIEKEGAILIPIPLHWRRLWQRKYNQAALLAQAVAKRAHCPVLLDGLQRLHYRPPQAGLSRAQRLTNLRGNFRVHPKHLADLQGKHVILIDDVMTTGATLNACARALKKAKVSRVYALTLARTVLEGDG